MTTFRNVLISIGIFLFSLRTIVLFAWPLVTFRATYGSSVLSTIGMGIVNYIGPTLAAVLAGVLVTFFVTGRRPERWSLLVAFLYVVDSHAYYHWHLPPTSWDRLRQTVDFALPGLVCIAAAFICARFRRQRPDLMITAD